MGYLTTFTVYNDGVDLVKENAQDFADKIYNAATISRQVSNEIPVGCFANLVKVQKCRHADDHTIYVHMGNGVFEMNPYSEETKNIAKHSPKFFEKMINYLERQVEQLKSMQNDSRPSVC